MHKRRYCRTPWLAARLTEELSRIEAQMADLRRTHEILSALVEDYTVTADAAPAESRPGSDAGQQPRAVGGDGDEPAGG